MFRLQHKTFFTLVAILCMLLSTTSSASAWVTTDQEDYAPGNIVTISGGNDETGAPGYLPGAVLNVTISGPHDPAYESTTCENVVIGQGGAWSCTVTLWADPEWSVGTYTYTGRSTALDGAPLEETGTFSDTRTITAATLMVGGSPVSQVTVSGGTAISARVTVFTTYVGNRDWKSTAWAIKQIPGGTDLNNFLQDLAGLFQLISPEPWTCVNHNNHAAPTVWPYSATFEETFDITAPATAGTYTVFFIAYANDTCSFSAYPAPSNPYWLANSIVVVPTKAPGSVSINNIPNNAVYGGNFTPTFEKQGDGATSVASLTPSTCTVTSGVVGYVGAGTCTLQASVAEGTDYLAATGPQQSFVIAKAAGSASINNIPNNAVYGGSFTPSFDKLGDGAPSVASLTPATCTVSSGIVSFIGVGTCTLQASVAEGTNYLAATGPQQSFTVKFQFIGFSQPVDNDVLNIAKAGQAIPLKFRLLDYNGVAVTNLASVNVTVASLSCSAATTTDAVEEYASGSSGLQNLGDGYYQWNWKTPTAYANSCKTLKLDLGEGAGNEHTALFRFKK